MTIEQIIYRLLLAVLIGGVIGAEREYRSKSAGFRTLILISCGAAIFTILSILVGGLGSPDRIASNVVTGIGFVGAGVVFKSENRMSGITTAATIWITAALGMAAGAGQDKLGLAGCLLTLLALIFFHVIESFIDRKNQVHQYTITVDNAPGITEKLESLFSNYHLKLRSTRYQQKSSRITCIWAAQGSQKNHQLLAKKILSDDTIPEFDFDENI